MCHIIDARLLVPTAVISLLTSLVSGLLSKLRQIAAASEPVSNVASNEETTSFREVHMRILTFQVEGESVPVSVDVVFDRTIVR